ncbi:PP2C family protein-serine/threonine phosphatase [Scytonema sp. NUACC26]|uniref:PP2C family protein-serine/threonine phosphatase n=1 Tax=Scytonema sp. NUACC26 TaxID=3140176 RepID=UPI0034DBA341
MTFSSTDSTAVLVIQVGTCFHIDRFRVEVKAYLGLFADVHYFHVNILALETESTLTEMALAKSGLLRVGTANGSLDLELKLREELGNHKMVSELLVSTIENLVSMNFLSEQPQEDCSVNLEQQIEADIKQTSSIETSSFEREVSPSETMMTSDSLKDTSEYLEEEFLEMQPLLSESPCRKLILLSYLPEHEKTLSVWLTQDHSLETTISLASQVCQFFRYIYQQGWCFVHIVPAFIQIGTPIQFFDLTGVRVVGEKLSYGLTGDYCPPELALGYPIDEQVSTYIVGTLLYQSIHHQPPNLDNPCNLEIKSIPRIYQIIHICLSPFGNRFSLSQLLSILVETRQLYSTPKIRWNVSNRSTVGLSLNRLQNEDSYGVKQHYSNQSETFILGVVADGMGGMAQGEIASRLAVKTVLENPIPAELKRVEDRALWITSLVQKANDCVAQNVREGGTTLSLILAFERELMIAHIGDSRIFLLRNGFICQLSEDHSKVAILLASSQITYEESKHHPERSVLVKSIGSKRKLSDGYIQDLSRFSSGLSMSLENGDILLLCSDGIWDLVPSDELAEIFLMNQSLQAAVNETIDRIISRGAIDNATILALQCYIEKYYE